jgi:hypothetical protein
MSSDEGDARLAGLQAYWRWPTCWPERKPWKVWHLLPMPRGKCISQLQIHDSLVHRAPLAKAIVRPWGRELCYRMIPGWRSRLLDFGRVLERVAAHMRTSTTLPAGFFVPMGTIVLWLGLEGFLLAMQIWKG